MNRQSQGTTMARTTRKLRCRQCGETVEEGPIHVCAKCFGPLEVVTDGEPSEAVSRGEIESRRRNLWRYREFLPVAGAPESIGRDVGFTPLVPAPRLGQLLGVSELWIKYDGACHPSHSFKDRVVAVALAAARKFDLPVVGCASTGNLANAVAAQTAGTDTEAWIFIPADLEPEKVVATAAYDPRLVRVDGVYDDVNRLCAELADRLPWGIVNVNLRPYYSEGSKTVAFEIAEQLGWRAPAQVVAPMAGGSLITKLQKGFAELDRAGLVEGGERVRLYGAQAEGCSPIVDALHAGEERVQPVRPDTIAKSLAIGDPADGPFALETIRSSGGWAETATDEEIRSGIRILARTEGIFTETAGGVTVAAADRLAAQDRFRSPEGPTVLCVTGNGLKTPGAVSDQLNLGPVIDGEPEEVEELVAG